VVKNGAALYFAPGVLHKLQIGLCFKLRLFVEKGITFIEVCRDERQALIRIGN
jgi:hypothetical protein